MIFLFFAWLVWGGFVAQSILSQNQKNQTLMSSQQFKSEGQMLDWFFQERTLQIRNLADDEPVISRYNSDAWKAIHPWKGVIFIKGNETHMYGVFDKVMPEAHRRQLIEKVKSLKPMSRFEGVHWEAFQWNGTPFVLGFISRSYGQQAFIAQGDDWGRTLSIIPSDNSWTIANQSGRIIFHTDSRYVGQKKPIVKSENEKDRDITSTNLMAYLQINPVQTARSLYVQLILITLGLALISSVLFTQVTKKERLENERRMEAFREQTIQEFEAQSQIHTVVEEGPITTSEHFLKELSHRVSSSLGRQLEPSLVNIMGQAQWLLSLGITDPKKRSSEENAAIETIIREVRAGKSILEKLLAVAGERKIELFPMKLETPIARVLRRWKSELENQVVTVEKQIGDTSFFPLNSEALEKALSHLIQNSLEAMSRQIEKRIRIEVRDEGDTLLMLFEDNGIGIEPHHLSVIADAFFTTKTKAKHLGLGLTEAFGIFKQHHAIVTVVSEVGKFTRFEIRFDKNEATNLLQKQEAGKARAFEEAVITVPENLPQVVGMTAELQFIESESIQVATKIEGLSPQAAVDEEIEKLLELNEIDFVEPQEPQEPEIEVQAASSARSQVKSSSQNSDFSDLIDVNPETKQATEEDDFEMKETSARRDLHA